MLNQTPNIPSAATAQRPDAAKPSNTQKGSTTDTFSTTLAKHIKDKSAQKAADAPKDTTKNGTASKGSTNDSTASKDSAKGNKKSDHAKAITPDTSLATITALPVNAALTQLKITATASELNLKNGTASLSDAAQLKTDKLKLTTAARLKGDAAKLAPDGSNHDATASKTTLAATKIEVAITSAAKTDTSILNIKTAPKVPSTAELAPSGMLPSTQAPQSGLPPTTPATSTIATPLNHNAWPTEFSQKINWMTNKQIQVAELHINPPNLGPMSVVLTIKDNQATALFASQHSAVRDAIQNALPQLRDSMADNGIMLGNATVSDQPSRDNNNNSNFMNQQSNNREQMGESEAAESISTATIRQHNGLVDTFA